MTQSKSFYLIAARNRGGTVFNTANVAARTVTPVNSANGRNGVEKSPPYTLKAGVHYDVSNVSVLMLPATMST
jgi:hypothetical protein